MNGIAAAAGVTKPVLYDHFPSKLRMYGALLEGIRDELLSQGAVIAQRAMSREQLFRAAVEAFFRYAQQQPDAVRVLLQVPQTDMAATRLWHRVQRGATVGIAALLGTVWRADESPEQFAAAEFLKSGLHALAQWRLTHPELEPSALVRVVMQVAWTGLGQAPQRRVHAIGRRRPGA